MDYSEVIKEAQELVLENKSDWETRYQDYANKILANNNAIKSLRIRFMNPLR